MPPTISWWGHGDIKNNRKVLWALLKSLSLIVFCQRSILHKMTTTRMSKLLQHLGVFLPNTDMLKIYFSMASAAEVWKVEYKCLTIYLSFQTTIHDILVLLESHLQLGKYLTYIHQNNNSLGLHAMQTLKPFFWGTSLYMSTFLYSLLFLIALATCFLQFYNVSNLCVAFSSHTISSHF